VLEFNKDLVLWNLEAADAHAVIDALAGRLFEQGLVSAEYGLRTFEREQEHPTGLPTTPFYIAFPHADADGVVRSALAAALLSRPVSFKNMADPDEDLDVHLVLMLANNNPEEQIQTLRSLALLFGQPDKLTALRSQLTPEDAAAWLRLELSLA
jgi:PTS system galactitol-specific IIA component